MNTMLRWDQYDFTIINIAMIVFFFALKTSHGINVSVVSFTFWNILSIWYQKQLAKKPLVLSANAVRGSIDQNGHDTSPNGKSENTPATTSKLAIWGS
jgi:hypothetical protein